MSDVQSRIAECVEAATRGLAPDPELRIEVARELRTHIEDAIRAAVVAGATEREAADRALGAFGNPEEVGREIRDANLRRMRTRSVLKWTARVTLLPAAAILLLVILLEAARSGSLFVSRAALVGGLRKNAVEAEAAWRWFSVIENSRTRHIRADLTEEERFALTSDTESLAARYPDNPLFHAAYVSDALSKSENYPLEKLLEVLRRGEEMEPDNAFYNYMAASVLFERGSEAVPDVGRTYEIESGGKVHVLKAHKLVVRDRTLVERAIEEMERGNAKRFYNSHAIDYAMFKTNLYRQPRTFVEELQRIAIHAGVRLPDLANLRLLTRSAVAYARLLAEEGRKEDAVRILKDITRPGLLVGSSSPTLIHLLVAREILVTPLREAALVYEDLGLSEEAAAARAEAESENAIFARLTSARSDQSDVVKFTREAGIIAGLIVPTGDLTERLDLRSWRLLERTLFERTALSAALALGFLALVYLGLRVSAALVMGHMRRDPPLILFPGWRRFFMVVAKSAVVPLVIYIAYSRLLPFGGARYGVNSQPWRIVLELALLGMAVFGVALVSSYHAIYARCRELGMEVPAKGMFRPGKAWWVIWGLAGAALIYYAYRWGTGTDAIGAVVTAIVVLTATGWLLATGWKMFHLRGSLGRFRATFLRSLLPLMGAVVIAFGLVAHTSLILLEHHYTRLLQRPGTRLGTDEIEFSVYREYREHLAEKARELGISATGSSPRL